MDFKRPLLPIALCCALLCCVGARAQDTLRLTDVGYVPNSRQNAVPFVNKALQACKNKRRPVLVFPKGRYDFWPQHCAEKQYYESNTDVIPLRRCPILIEGFAGLTIDCQGSDFVFHDRLQPFTIDKSRDITLRNVNIDWDIPMTAQGQVVATTDNYIDIAINVLESPYILEDGKIVFVGEGWKSRLWGWGVMEFDKDTKLIPQGTGDESCLGNDYDRYRATEIRYGLVRMHHRFTRKPAVGNYLVLRHSARDHAGVFIADSKDVLIENLNMYQNAGLGILSQYAENLTFRKINCVPNPAKNRILSGHDDGFHFSNCKGQIVVDSCRFLALMDDPINVHGTSVQVVEKVDDRTLRCRFMHDQSIGFVWAGPGDKVGFIENEAMNTFSAGVVETFTAQDSLFFQIRFKDPCPADLQLGDALENLSWTPDVLIQNSFFGSNRARGILLTSPGRIVVQHNVFESSGAAILIAGDANGWFESGAVQDVTIRDNTFNDPCMSSMYQFCEGIISIYPEIPKMDRRKPFHRNIRIENNRFYPFDYPVLYAKSTAGLYFNHNTIQRSRRFRPFHARKAMISLESCQQVEIKQNRLIGEVLGKNIRLLDTPASEVVVDKGQGMVVEQ